VTAWSEPPDEGQALELGLPDVDAVEGAPLAPRLAAFRRVRALRWLDADFGDG